MKQKSSCQIAREYIEHIKNEEWDKLYDLCQITWKKGNIVTSEHFRNMYEMLLPINDFEIKLKTNESGTCLKQYIITINNSVKMLMNIVCEKAAFKSDINGTWGVNPISTLRREYL